MDHPAESSPHPLGPSDVPELSDGVSGHTATEPPIAADPSVSTQSDEGDATRPEMLEPPLESSVGPDPVPESELAVVSDDVLEEQTLPSLVQPPEQLAPGAEFVDGRVRVERYIGSWGKVNRYDILWAADDGQPVTAELREGAIDHSGLRIEAEIFSAIRYAMFPRLLTTFETPELRYLVLDSSDGVSLEAALQSGLDTSSAVALTLQLVQAVRRLHNIGWAAVGL